MAIRLPRWVVSNDESIRREVEPFRSMSFAERARILDVLCREGEEFALAGGRANEIFAWRDPLPSSSVAALAKLRAQYQAKRATGRSQ